MGILGAALATVAGWGIAAAAPAKGPSHHAVRIAGATADAVAWATGGGLTSSLDATTHEPLTLTVGIDMGKPLRDWLQASVDHGMVREDVEIFATDVHHDATLARALDGAVITEVTLPPLDGSSKDPAYLTIRIEPETTHELSPPAAPLVGVDEVGPDAAWLASGFRLELEGLPCDRVLAIDELTWEQEVVRDQSGALQPSGAPPQISLLRLDVDARDLSGWQAWQQSSEQAEAGGSLDERTASLTLLGPDLQEELMTIEFSHVGIVSLQPPEEPEDEDADEDADEDELDDGQAPPAAPATGSVARFTVELYVEEMTISSYWSP